LAQSAGNLGRQVLVGSQNDTGIGRWLTQQAADWADSSQHSRFADRIG
jgi:hypothetical protein